MPETNNRNGNKVVRGGLLSRIDYGSDGFRQGLLELAAETFKNEDVAFVVLAGGLVSGRAVGEKTRRLKRDQRDLQRAMKAAERNLLREADARKAGILEKEIARLKRKHGKVVDQIQELTPEKMADELAKCLPRFTNAKGETVKLYLIPSPAYDKLEGERTAQLLAEKRGRDELRLLKAGGDRLPLWVGAPDERLLEVLTPERTPWRGDYVSTGVERRLKDKRKQTSASAQPDLAAVGGFAVTILKPKGEAVMPFMAIPALHRIEDTTVNENQIGVQVMEVHRDRVCPTMRSHSFKDLISRERSFIGMPSDLSPARQKIIDMLKKHGRCTIGRIADETGMDRGKVMKAVKDLLATKDHKRYKTWPGLVYDEPSDRVDFDLEWVQRNLRYRLPGGQRVSDVIVGFGCLHAGSLDTDYRHFLTDVPKVMLDKGAGVLVGAGDFVEGLAHNMMLRGDIYAGLNLTKQEELAGHMIAHIIMAVFKARFEEALKKREAKTLTKEEAAELVLTALVIFFWIPGNHDLWDTNTGHEPLVTMVATIVRSLADGIEKFLVAKGLSKPDGLNALIERRVLNTRDGRFLLPSGLRMSVMHPHMARSKTTSIRPQETLEKAHDCPVVVEANFHVGEVVELWEPKLGQRICVQIGTMKHGSPFEDNKLKTVDQGFAYAKIDSVEGRIVRTETTFYSNDNAKPEEKKLDPEKPFRDFLKEIGVTL